MSEKQTTQSNSAEESKKTEKADADTIDFNVAEYEYDVTLPITI